MGTFVFNMDTKNYNFFMKQSMSEYVGKWVAICDEKIVSSGKNPKMVYDEAHAKYPKCRPLLTRIPEKAAMIF